MRLLELHTCPLWEERDGARTVGLRERRDHPPVFGWVNAARIRIDGKDRWFLLTLDAAA